jgi:hypothetical protein
VNGQSWHANQHAFSHGRSTAHFHRDNGLGAFLSPYFFPNGESYWSEEPRPEPAGAEPEPQVVYASPERERPPADAQVIEIPSAADQKQEQPPEPAIFVLINGERIETHRFVLTVNNLSVNVDRQERVIPLEAVDFDATTAANRERGINLRIPADPNEISLSF